MKRRNFSTLDQEIVSTEQGLAATRSISSRRPVGGEMFFLTAPFRERWANDNIDLLCDADPATPDVLNDREADCWRPLLAIADRAGGEWPHLARSAAVSLSNSGP